MRAACFKVAMQCTHVITDMRTLQLEHGDDEMGTAIISHFARIKAWCLRRINKK